MQIENKPLGKLAFLSETIYLTYLGFCFIIHKLGETKSSKKQQSCWKGPVR